jgi:hypothetical protein
MADETKIEISVPRDLRAVYWGALGLGALLLLLGFGSKEYGYLIAACFFGIASRIVQAEHHHRELEKRAV